MITLNNKLNILYLDDEVHNLESFTACFRREYNIYTANSAVEAMEILQKQPIHLIVTDQRMPDMTGVQFLESVTPHYPEAVRVILTGFAEIDVMIEAINTGKVYRYIMKPWDERELKATLDAASKAYLSDKYKRDRIGTLEEEVKEQQRLINLYKKYIPEHLADDLIVASDIDLTDGQSRIVTILFVEIIDLCGAIQGMEAKEVLNLLNAYFELMDRCVTNNQGTINKSIGGGLIALFGAPISSIDNPVNAVSCGIEMLDLLKQFNLQHKSDLSIAISINTGDVIVGNTMFHDHPEYMVIGHTVKIGYRLLSIAKEMKNSLLLGEATYQAIQRNSILSQHLNLQSAVVGKESISFVNATALIH